MTSQQQKDRHDRSN